MRTKSPALALAVFLLLGALSAAPAAAEPRETGENGLWVQLSSLVASFWSGAASLTDLGCILEPYGSCSPTSSPAADLGCAVEPYGGCTSTSVPVEHLGCAVEPNGGCAANHNQAEAGCILDPDGRCRG